jgi:hypothetical protein
MGEAPNKVIRTEPVPHVSSMLCSEVVDEVRSGAKRYVGTGSCIWGLVKTRRPAADLCNSTHAQSGRFRKCPKPARLVVGETKILKD